MRRTRKWILFSLAFLVVVSVMVGILLRPKTCRHEFGDWTVIREATCRQMGAKRRICMLCEEVETQPISAAEHTFDWVVDVQPTLTQTGLQHEECSVCGAVRQENTLMPMLQHEHVYLGPTQQEPTCVTNGTRSHYLCTCGSVFVWENEAYAEVTESELILPPLSHSFTSYVSNHDATLTADGTKTAHCDRPNCSATNTLPDVGSRLTETQP